MMDITMTDRRRVLVLNGHPSRSSLRAALAEEAAKAAGEAGAEVRLRHLEDMIFDPDLTEGCRARKDLEPDLTAFQAALTWCRTLILVHPLWWGGPPAKLKGLFDGALLPGFAFASVEGKPLPDKLLAGPRAGDQRHTCLAPLAGLSPCLAGCPAPPDPRFHWPEGDDDESRRPHSRSQTRCRQGLVRGCTPPCRIVVAG
jgi:hypothetical protein